MAIYSKDRRKYLRYIIKGGIVLKLEDGTARSVKTDLVNISFTGLSVYAKEEIEPGINVQIELITKLTLAPIIAKGRTKYVTKAKKHDSKGFKIGVEFVDVDKQDIEGVLQGLQRLVALEKRKKEQAKEKVARKDFDLL